LWYRPAAPVLSLILSPLGGLLLIFVLTRAGLLLDLAVTRGVAQDAAAVSAWAETHLDRSQAAVLARMAEDRQGIGMAALAARTQEEWFGGYFSTLARTFPQLHNNYVYLAFLIIGLLLGGLLFSLVCFLQKRTAAWAAIDATTRLRRSVHTHAYRIGALTLRNAGNGQVIGNSMRALDALQEGLYGWFGRNFHESATIVLLLVFLLSVDCMHGFPWAALLILSALLLYWLVASWVTAWARRAERINALKAAEGQNLLQESLAMLRLVKTYGMESHHKQRLERLLHRQARFVQARWHWKFLGRHGRGLIVALIGPVLALALVGNILSGELQIVPLALILLTIACLYAALRRWQQAWQQVSKAKPAAAAIFALLDRATDVKQVVGAEFLPPLADHLELAAVTVGAPRASAGQEGVLLDGVSIRVAAGENVALVGDERARLAIAYLLPRLIDPDAGEVRIDNKSLPWVTLESLRKQVALVLQDDLTWSDSVAGNIGCGDEKYSLPQIIEAAKAAHAHNFIMKLPDGYETMIGELGESLTLSQRYRIALARAILRDPTLVVIEEPADGLEEQDKAWLDDTMQRFVQRRTALLLANRLSTVRKADRVILLHRGRFADAGTDSELLGRSELYKHWQYQHFHGFPEEAVDVPAASA
jgi:ATP-binding cassette subfamily B protein